jgi:hypothetical protein
VTFGLEIEAIQLTPGLIIVEVPATTVTVIPAKRFVTLFNWTVAPLPATATVLFIAAVQAVAVVAV